MKKTLAILSPSKNAYSETFISAHKNLPFNIKFYFGGSLPSALESENAILQLSFPERIRRFFLKNFSFEEKRLLFSLRKQKVHCVLAEYGPTACESLKVIKYLQLPLIVHFHGFDASEKKVLERYAATYKEVFEYAIKVIAVSNTMYNSLLQLGCPVDKLVLNYYGPDNSFFQLHPHFSNSQFVSVGRFVEKKAPYLTISAFRMVVEKFSEAKLVMAGEGELLNVCKNLVKAWKLESNVRFAGILDAEQIKTLFQDSIAFVQHSVVATNGDSEGTPVAILEAHAAGLPVISTNHAGIPDVVVNNKTGLLANEFDIAAMAENMITLLSKENFAKQLGENGRKRVEENFTMAKHLRILQEQIEECSL